tara:strand:- start:1438 stop:1821 length:384 start_codon:yes stop_codon:yes gene_type:complete
MEVQTNSIKNQPISKNITKAVNKKVEKVSKGTTYTFKKLDNLSGYPKQALVIMGALENGKTYSWADLEKIAKQLAVDKKLLGKKSKDNPEGLIRQPAERILGFYRNWFLGSDPLGRGCLGCLSPKNG